ncbi:hypothetical protein [Fischerella major]|uniref:hypothetical protein n=1 Tax=Fischerella major TaxID=210993 RepID=UPI000AD3BF0A|nr:hypothetical protein [Fischerella major]
MAVNHSQKCDRISFVWIYRLGNPIFATGRSLRECHVVRSNFRVELPRVVNSPD